MNAVTERIPRIVVLHPHPSYRTTQSPAVVRAYSLSPPQRIRPRPSGNTARRRARKVPAPLGLRIMVSLLIVVFFASMAGVVAQRARPKWFTGLENYIHPRSPGVISQPAQLLDHAVLVSSTPTSIVYQVPAARYSIVLSVDHRCWFIVKSPAGGTSTLAAMVLAPSASPMSIPVYGSSSLMVGAQTRSVAIISGTHRLGSIASPRVGVIYTFESKP